MAELESSLISGRVTAGMQAAKARGKQMVDRRSRNTGGLRQKNSPPPLI
jgi:DNA invertase Pin-like site-specific DNA recombinase